MQSPSSDVTARRRRSIDRAVRAMDKATIVRYVAGFLCLVVGLKLLFPLIQVPVYLAFVLTSLALGVLALAYSITETRALGARSCDWSIRR